MTKVVLEFSDFFSSHLLAVVSDMFLCSLRMLRNMTRKCVKVSGSDTPGTYYVVAPPRTKQPTAAHYDRGVFLLKRKTAQAMRARGEDTHTKRYPHKIKEEVISASYYRDIGRP